MNKHNLQMLYEVAKSEDRYDEYGIPRFDEQKLRRTLATNDKLGRRNRDIFSASEIKFHTCPRYDPCPICDKCRNKASHLYKECEVCRIPICSHTYRDRERMIKRKNFITYVTKEVMDYLDNLYESVKGGGINA